MSRGVIDLLGLAGSVVFAIPVAFFGLLRMLDGDLLVGTGFVVFAAVMVVGMEIYTSPTDVAGNVLSSAVGKIAKRPDDEE
jgi:inner membrane protein involved in colicin E2 resistance